MKTFTKFATCALALGVIVGLCPAPIPDSRPIPHIPEQSQAQLAEQQKFNGVQGEVGGVPTRQDSVTVASERSDSGAARTLIQAENTTSANVARENLLVAERVLARQNEGPGKSILIGVIVLLLAAGAVLLFKAWADKAIPVPDIAKPKTRW